MLQSKEGQRVNIKGVEELRSLGPEVKTAYLAEGDRTFERHVNRNGDVGGFVESTASAGPHTYVGEKALVLQGAKMFEHSMAYGTATVMEDAVMWDDARLYQNGILRGNAKAEGDVHIAEDTVIGGTFVVSGHVHVYNATLTGRGLALGHAWFYGGLTWMGEGQRIETDQHFTSAEQIRDFIAKEKQLLRTDGRYAGPGSIVMD